MAEKRITRIALVNPPPPDGALVHYHCPLIGVAYIAAALQKNGYEVTVIDCPPLGITYDGLKQKIALFKPDIVGITSVTVTFSSAAQAAKVIKESYPKALIVLGGPHVTVLDEQIVRENPQVDVIVRGEGEQTMLELAGLVASSNLTNLSKIDGITFLHQGQLLRTADRKLIQDLDELPDPAYNLFPLDKYRLYGRLMLPITTSRGCFAKCSFCLAPKMAGGKVRLRSPKHVVDELERAKKLYKPDAFTFHDDTFTADNERTIAICDEIKKRKINLPWDCSTRVDRITKEILQKMKEAGCQLVSFGAESGNQKILNIMRKGTTVELNAQAIKWCKELGLSVTISMIIGYPGETEETLKDTFDFIKRTKPDDVHLSIATPYPGIELNKTVKEMGLRMTDDWSHCDMQAQVIENPALKTDLVEARQQFYHQFYSSGYIIRHTFNRNFYSKNIARGALNNYIWRVMHRSHGIIYLLSNPKQAKWLFIRETRFRYRKTRKPRWVQWQKYDAKLHISHMKARPVTQTESTLNKKRIQIFSDMINPIGKNLNILDAGCGDGVISEPLLKMGNFVTSVELSDIIDLAPKHRVPFAIAGDIEQLACASNTFDLVVASEVVEHLWNPESFFAEAHRVLKDESYLIVETPEGKGSLNYDSHMHFFTIEILKEQLANKFAFCKVERLKAGGLAQTPTIIMLFRKV